MPATEQTVAKDHSIENFDAEAVNSKANRSLYEARKKIHPKRVNGSYRRLKWWIMALTLGIYYLTPWLRWDQRRLLCSQLRNLKVGIRIVSPLGS